MGTSALAVPVPGQGTWETTLQARDLNRDGVTDAFYDTSLNITWRSNANTNGLMNWSAANTWANDLTFGGYSDWRLPTLTPVNGTNFTYAPATNNGSNDGGTAKTGIGWGTASELGHLYYVSLGNKGICVPNDVSPLYNGCTQQAGFGPINTGNFQNLPSFSSWTGLPVAGFETSVAWAFGISNGYQGGQNKSTLLPAFAVRNGDVAPPTCTAPQVLQGNGCVTITGALPTPKNFTSQVAFFALNNVGLLSTIASQNGNNAFQVTGSTKQLLSPQSNKYLYDSANSVADRLEKVSVGVATEIAYLEALGKSGAKKQALSLMGSIANYFGFKWADKAAQQSGTWYGQRSVLLADLTSTLGSCVIDATTSPNKVQALALCSASLIAFNVDNGLVPLLRLYAIDPPNPNYKTIVMVSLPTPNIADPELQATVDALLVAQAYLGAVNETYDRYVSAYNAGDTDSALLQIQAYLTLLSEYNNAVLKAKQGIADVLNVLAANPVVVNAADLQALLAAMQEEINVNGLGSDIVTVLTGLGLDGAQIWEVQNDILSFQYSPTGTLQDNVNGLLVGLDAISVPNVVPAPGTLYLVVLAFLMAWFCMRRKRKISAFEQALAHFPSPGAPTLCTRYRNICPTGAPW